MSIPGLVGGNRLRYGRGFGFATEYKSMSLAGFCLAFAWNTQHTLRATRSSGCVQVHVKGKRRERLVSLQTGSVDP